MKTITVNQYNDGFSIVIKEGKKGRTFCYNQEDDASVIIEALKYLGFNVTYNSEM